MVQAALAARQALWVAVQIGAPPLLALLVVGLLIAVLQALTQVNEASVSFLPKLAALGGVLLLLAPFMTGVLRGYAEGVFDLIVTVGTRP